MAARKRLIGPADALLEAGSALRFSLMHEGEEVSAFAIRWQGRVHAYLNRCAHQPVELDFKPGEFFDASGQYLLCATHAALYDPASGQCLSGRCNGKGLHPLAVLEADGSLYLINDKDPQ